MYLSFADYCFDIPFIVLVVFDFTLNILPVFANISRLNLFVLLLVDWRIFFTFAHSFSKTTNQSEQYV